MNSLIHQLDDLLISARSTPAWVERHLATATTLVQSSPSEAGPEVEQHLNELATMFDTVPQVVGVADDARLTRAVWVEECLLLTVAFDTPDPERRTMFRIVRAEPRVWYQTGIDGANNEITQSAVIVRLPCVDGDLEFVPGSY